MWTPPITGAWTTMLLFWTGRSPAGGNVQPGISGRELLVEDNALNAEIAQVLLTDYGFQVDVVGDRREALERMRVGAGSYDLVFMDVQMLVMDGHKATMAIRKSQIM